MILLGIWRNASNDATRKTIFEYRWIESYEYDSIANDFKYELFNKYLRS